MKYFPIPQLQGVIKDYHSRMIPDNKCAEAMNVMFRRGTVANRWGYGQFGQQLNGAITNISYYEKLRTRQNYIIAFTPTDTYLYNKSTGIWELITWSYSTGTVSNTGGTSGHRTTVTVSTGTFLEFADCGRLFIKFGDTNLNGSGTWYPVTYTSAAVLTGVDLPNATTSQYVVRACWQGGASEHHSVAFPYYDDGESFADNIVMVSNGVDIPQWWDGIGVFRGVSRTETFEATSAIDSTILTGIATSAMYNIAVGDTITGDDGALPSGATTVVAILSDTEIQLSQAADEAETGTFTVVGVKPNPAKNISFFGSVGFEHTILANTKDIAHENIQTLEYSRAGHPFMWEGNYDDLFDSNDEILGIVPLETRLIVYKRFNMSMLMPNLNPTASDFFIINENTKRDVGTVSIRTVKNLGNYHIFMGWDDVYIYDGINVTRIGGDIIQHLISIMNRDRLANCFAVNIDEESLYCLFVPIGDGQVYPNYCFCFNYQEKHWTIWQLADEMTAYGFFTKDIDAPTYGDMIIFTTTDAIATDSYDIEVADATGIQVGMSVFDYETEVLGYPGNYFPASGTVRKVVAIDDDTITLDDYPDAAYTGSGTVNLKIGWAYEDLTQRYRDMIVQSNYNAYLLGDKDGFIYEFAPSFTSDRGGTGVGTGGKSWTASTAPTVIPDPNYIYEYPDDDAMSIADYYTNERDIKALIITGDYELNDVKHTFRINETTLGYIRQAQGYFKIWISVDFGAHWSPMQLIPMNTVGINGGLDFVEYINKWSRRGTQIRIRIANRDASNYYNPFQIESLLIGFNEDGGERR